MKNKKNMRRFLSGFLAMLTVLSTILSPILSYSKQICVIIRDCREIPKSFCSDDETIGLVQEIYGTKVNKGICCVFCYNNLPAKNVLSEYVCDYKKRAGLFQRSADLE